MNVEIWKESKPEPKPKKVLLRLASRPGMPGVYVEAVNEDGTHTIGGYLLRITSEGILLVDGMVRELGFPLDRCGRLKILD